MKTDQGRPVRSSLSGRRNLHGRFCGYFPRFTESLNECLTDFRQIKRFIVKKKHFILHLQRENYALVDFHVSFSCLKSMPVPLPLRTFSLITLNIGNKSFYIASGTCGQNVSCG